MTSFGWNPTCLTKDGKPWLPIMGEIHFPDIHIGIGGKRWRR